MQSECDEEYAPVGTTFKSKLSMVKSTLKMQPNYTRKDKINMTDARKDKPVKLQINNYNPYTKHEDKATMKSYFDGPSRRSIVE